MFFKAERIRDLDQLPLPNVIKVGKFTKQERGGCPRPGQWPGQAGGTGQGIYRTFALILPALAIYKWALAIRTFSFILTVPVSPGQWLFFYSYKKFTTNFTFYYTYLATIQYYRNDAKGSEGHDYPEPEHKDTQLYLTYN